MSRAQWSDHFEHRLELEHAEGCQGRPVYSGGLDQNEFCADGCVSFNGDDFHLPVSKLAEFVRTLYEAAGKPAPVILERPAQIPGPGEGNAFGRDLSVFNPGNATVGVSLRHHAETLPPAEARRMAAHLLARADEAEAECDPAELAELAEEIRSDVARIGGNPTEAFEIAARTALRWMREREATP